VDSNFYSSGLFTPTNMGDKLKVFFLLIRNTSYGGFFKKSKKSILLYKREKVLLRDNRINAE